MAPLLGIREVSTPSLPLQVTSTPSDAEVYLNDRFVGRTPCTLPIVLNVDTATMLPKEIPVIRVSKEGYRDEAKAMSITQRGSSLEVEPSEMHFTLRQR